MCPWGRPGRGWRAADWGLLTGLEGLQTKDRCGPSSPESENVLPSAASCRAKLEFPSARSGRSGG